MMKDEELWLKKIKERLDDYSEPLPDAGWERLERALTTVPPMSVRMKKKVQFRRWVMTAAAVGLVAVSSLSLWLVYSPMVDEVNRSVESVLTIKPDELPEQAKPSVRGEQPEPGNQKDSGTWTGCRTATVCSATFEGGRSESECTRRFIG